MTFAQRNLEPDAALLPSPSRALWHFQMPSQFNRPKQDKTWSELQRDKGAVSVELQRDKEAVSVVPP